MGINPDSRSQSIVSNGINQTIINQIAPPPPPPEI